MADVSEYRKIDTVRDGHWQQQDDAVVVESPLTIYFNGKELVTMLCTPQDLENLAVGFLYSEGFIEQHADIESLRTDPGRGVVEVTSKRPVPMAEQFYGRRTITSGCGKGTTFFSAWDSLRSKPLAGGTSISAACIHKLMQTLQAEAVLFKKTGGVHSAALCDADGVIYMSEDVGRHNAVDKIVGRCLQAGVGLQDKLVVSSGRISSEMLLKAAKLQVPILVSRSAPTTFSVDVAREMNITLVGFARGKRLNVYAAPERIKD